eukprot:TRINITY_DN644_c0_g3_i2.p1 TRINITY_DN644_c0_g3~~TRINITY_DN644_c0_g3_i2.p1  ORF type:complete len:519 (+),score=71.69 TRINITY_DN644_c0_g3_i2:52-1608(+)
MRWALLCVGLFAIFNVALAVDARWFNLGISEVNFAFRHAAGFSSIPNEWGDRRMVCFSGQQENYALSKKVTQFNYGLRQWQVNATYDADDAAFAGEIWPQPRTFSAKALITTTTLYNPPLPDYEPNNPNITYVPDVNRTKPYAYEMAALEQGDSLLYLYGGLVGGFASKEIRILNLTSGLWLDQTFSEVGTDPNHISFPTSGATAVYDGVRTIYIYGGRYELFQISFISKVDIISNTVTGIDVDSGPAVPSARWGHVAAHSSVSGGRMYVFGGRHQPGEGAPEILGDVQIFDYGDEEWKSVPSQTQNNAPSARSFMSAEVSPDGAYWIIFGGVDDSNPNNKVYFNDVHRLRFSNGAFEEVQIVQSPDSPSNRAEMQMVPLFLYNRTTLSKSDVIEESYLFFGGRDPSGTALGDVYKLQFTGLASGGGDGDGELPPILGSSSGDFSFSEPSFSTIETGSVSDGDDNTLLIILLSTLIPCCVICCCIILILICIILVVAYMLYMIRRIKKIAAEEGAELT